MSEKMSHEDLKMILAAYALDALGPEEQALVRSHLESCAECTQELDDYLETIAWMAELDTRPLPEGFADRVAAATSKTVTVAERPSSRQRLVIASLVAAAVLLIGATVTSIIVAVGIRQQANRVRSALAAVVGSPHSIDFSGLTGVRASIVAHEHGALFVAVGLQEAPQTRTYQLWVVHSGRIRSVATFKSSDGIATVPIASDLTAFDAALVTVEPEGGSPQPTRNPILKAP